MVVVGMEMNESSDLRERFGGEPVNKVLLQTEIWMPSKIGSISPMVELLMQLIAANNCAAGQEGDVQLALREALNNAVVHGNAMSAHKLVQVRVRCEVETGLQVVVTDCGEGFDPSAVPSPLTAERLLAENGRGIHLMKSVMDEVSFKNGGTEVHMRKLSIGNPQTDVRFNSKE